MVRLYASDDLSETLKSVPLAEFLMVAQVCVKPYAEAPASARDGAFVSGCKIEAGVSDWEKCPRCWRYVETLKNSLCERCEEA